MAWVGLVTQCLQGGTIRLADRVSGTQAIERGLGVVEATLDPGVLARDRCDLFLDQMHHGLEEVVVEPHLVVETIEQTGLFDGVQAIIADDSSHQGGILLFHLAIVILVIGATARQDGTADTLAEETQEVLVQELAAVVRVQFQDGEGQPRQNKPNAHSMTR